MHADADRPEVPECIAARGSLLQRISALDLPANFLDELVHQLGGPGEQCSTRLMHFSHCLSHLACGSDAAKLST